jgi:uncharacterized membrane protein
MKRLSSLVKRELFTGFLLIAPVGGTAYLVYWLVTSVDGLFPDAWRPHIAGHPLPGLGLISVALLALGAGIAAHNFMGRRLVALFDDLVHRIPLFGSTYGLIKQVLEGVFSSGGGSFKRAVLVEYPVAGSWAIGFVAQAQVTGKLRDATDTEVLAVYVPTTPNPTSGYYLLVDRDKVRELDIPVEQAFKMVLTMGLADSEALATTAKWSRQEALKKS